MDALGRQVIHEPHHPIYQPSKLQPQPTTKATVGIKTLSVVLPSVGQER